MAAGNKSMKKERDVNLMRQSNMKKRLLALATTVLTLVMCVVPAFAADTNVAPKDNLTTTFEKYLVMDENANVPNVTFKFTIAAGASVAASGSNPAIYAGDDSRYVTGDPTVGQAVFAPGNNTYTTTTESGDSVELDTGEKYAKQTVTVDFRGVQFKAPGIYRYIITESENTQDGITDDKTPTRTLDVFVQYKTGSETELQITNYILYPGTKIDATNENAKDDGFTNNYETSNLTLTKNVTGNQGDRDKYFRFEVVISNAVAGTKYDVTLPTDTSDLTADDLVSGKDDSLSGDNKNVNLSELTATGGTVTGIYYLKNGQSITINGLTAGTYYTITETSYANDGYTTSNTVDGTTSQNTNTTDSKTMGSQDHTVIFTNHKQGNVPTGVLLETAPYIVLGLVVLAGLVVLFATRRRRTGE